MNDLRSSLERSSLLVRVRVLTAGHWTSDVPLKLPLLSMREAVRQRALWLEASRDDAGEPVFERVGTALRSRRPLSGAQIVALYRFIHHGEVTDQLDLPNDRWTALLEEATAAAMTSGGTLSSRIGADRFSATGEGVPARFAAAWCAPLMSVSTAGIPAALEPSLTRLGEILSPFFEVIRYGDDAPEQRGTDFDTVSLRTAVDRRVLPLLERYLEAPDADPRAIAHLLDVHPSLRPSVAGAFNDIVERRLKQAGPLGVDAVLADAASMRDVVGYTLGRGTRYHTVSRLVGEALMLAPSGTTSHMTPLLNDDAAISPDAVGAAMGNLAAQAFLQTIDWDAVPPHLRPAEAWDAPVHLPEAPETGSVLDTLAQAIEGLGRQGVDRERCHRIGDKAWERVARALREVPYAAFFLTQSDLERFAPAAQRGFTRARGECAEHLWRAADSGMSLDRLPDFVVSAVRSAGQRVAAEDAAARDLLVAAEMGVPAAVAARLAAGRLQGRTLTSTGNDGLGA